MRDCEECRSKEDLLKTDMEGVCICRECTFKKR